MRVAILHNYEYLYRYPFTDPKLTVNELKKAGFETILFNEVNIFDLAEELNEIDLLFILSNAIHNPIIFQYFNNELQTQLMSYIREGLGVVLLHQANKDEYLPLSWMGISVYDEPRIKLSFKEDITNIKINYLHSLVKLSAFNIQTLKDEIDKVRKDPILSSYHLFTAAVDPSSHIEWVMSRKVESELFIYMFTTSFGRGRLFVLLGPWDWFKIGLDLIRYAALYVAKGNFIAHKDGVFGPNDPTFARITINYDSNELVNTESLMNVVTKNNKNIELITFKPGFLANILTEILTQQILNSKNGLIRDSPRMTIDVLFPLVAINPLNSLYVAVFSFAVDKLYNNYILKDRSSIVDAPSLIRCLATYSILRTYHKEIAQKYDYIIEKLETFLMKLIKELMRIDETTSSINEIKKIIIKEYIASSYILKHVIGIDNIRLSLFESNSIELVKNLDAHNSLVNEQEYLTLKEILDILSSPSASPRMLSGVLIQLLLKPSYDILLLLYIVLGKYWPNIHSFVTQLTKEPTKSETIKVDYDRLARLIAENQKLQKRIEEIEAELRTLKKATIIFKGRTPKEWGSYIKEKLKRYIDWIIIIITILSGMVAVLQYLKIPP